MSDWTGEARGAANRKANTASAAETRMNSMSAVCGTANGDAGVGGTPTIPATATPTTTTIAGITTAAIPPAMQTAVPVWREDVLGAREFVLIALGRRATWTIADLKLRLKSLTGLSLHQQQSQPKAQNHQQIYEEPAPPPEYGTMNLEHLDTNTLVAPPLFIVSSSTATDTDHSNDDSSAFSISSLSSGGSADSNTSLDINDVIGYVGCVAQTHRLLSTPILNSGSGIKRNWVTNDKNNDDLNIQCICDSDDFNESKTLDSATKDPKFFNEIKYVRIATEFSHDSTADGQFYVETVASGANEVAPVICSDIDSSMTETPRKRVRAV
ncbi:hypothetical protein HK100_003604 [Physocladia obscura]|uniref:Uncharacterized protein n=1 Tax=Physocladia obscura TaxID=109957 RepID=A0AAD5XAD4_9FUNG|nr:hypothetical protein HK100_003604 [Physocladia obscura]